MLLIKYGKATSKLGIEIQKDFRRHFHTIFFSFQCFNVLGFKVGSLTRKKRTLSREREKNYLQ